MADEDDRVPQKEQNPAPARAAWHIKGVQVAVREAAVTAAMKQGQRMGNWIKTAALNQMPIETGDGAGPPVGLAVPLRRQPGWPVVGELEPGGLEDGARPLEGGLEPNPLSLLELG